MPDSRSSPRTTFKPQVVLPALAVIGALLVVCALHPNESGALFSSGQQWVVARFDWFYVLAVTTFLVFLVLIAASDFGNIRLGPDDAEPEFSFLSWTAMLFAAGMGIGLMYFGVGEPMQHFLKPPTVDPGTPAAAREAMLMTFFHWGFHAWAIYGLMGLVLAYFGFRYNLPLTLRSGLYPVLRERVNGWIGHAVDAFALVGTVAGIATTLGYGVMQLSAGLHTVAGWDTSGNAFRIGLVVIVVILAGASAASGLDKGVRRLSELNLLLAFLLLAFVVVAGPTSFLLRALGDNIGQYLSNLVDLSFRTYAYAPPREEGWFGGWTILYWAWWVSWSPFVGMFIARISRGRTIRQFVIGVLLVPTAFNLVWMTVFGNSAIWLDTHGAAGALAQTAGSVDALLFRFFDFLPLPQLLSIVSIVLIAVFFVTSADSGAFVIDQIATRGTAHSPVWQRLFWAALLGVTAAVLLVAGGLGALQAMTLIAGCVDHARALLRAVARARGRSRALFAGRRARDELLDRSALAPSPDPHPAANDRGRRSPVRRGNRRARAAQGRGRTAGGRCRRARAARQRRCGTPDRADRGTPRFRLRRARDGEVRGSLPGTRSGRAGVRASARVRHRHVLRGRPARLRRRIPSRRRTDRRCTASIRTLCIARGRPAYASAEPRAGTRNGGRMNPSAACVASSRHAAPDGVVP